jgi:hypothetical protein
MLMTKSARPQRVGSTLLETAPPPSAGKSRVMTASTNLCAGNLHKCPHQELLLRRSMDSRAFSGRAVVKNEFFL